MFAMVVDEQADMLHSWKIQAARIRDVSKPASRHRVAQLCDLFKVGQNGPHPPE